MPDLFQMDLKDWKRFKKMLKRAPKSARKAAAFTLTGFALGTNRHARQIIGREMVMRNPKFISDSIKTTFAKKTDPISRMQALVGSVERPRYTGLKEQELGTTSPRNRVFTKAARDGTFSEQAKGWARLKPNAKYPSPNKTRGLKTKEGRDFGLQGLSGAKRIVAFLMILNERRSAQTFVIRRRFGRFKRGLYRFKQGVIRKLQAFDTKPRPKRVRWLTGGQRAYFRSVNIGKIWHRNILHELKKFK